MESELSISCCQKQIVTLRMTCKESCPTCLRHLIFCTYSAVTGSVLYLFSTNLLHWSDALLLCISVRVCVFVSPGPVHSAVRCVHPCLLSDWQAKFPPHCPTPPPPQGVPAANTNHTGGKQERPCPFPWNQQRGYVAGGTASTRISLYAEVMFMWIQEATL